MGSPNPRNYRIQRELNKQKDKISLLATSLLGYRSTIRTVIVPTLSRYHLHRVFSNCFPLKVPEDRTETRKSKLPKRAWSYCSSTRATFDYRFVCRSRFISQPHSHLIVESWKAANESTRVAEHREAGSHRFNVSFI